MAFQPLVADLSKVETKVEIRNYKNRMNKKQRKKSLFFCAPSTFPCFLREVQFYSPLLFKDLNDFELSDLIKHGFYNFVKTGKPKSLHFDLDRLSGYRIEIDRKARKSMESNFMIVFYSFLQDLGKEIGLSIFDREKPFTKKEKLKF